MPCEQTWWERKSLLDLSYFLLPYLTQTLTTLNLYDTQIGDKGAQYLGEALRTNTVREKESAWFILSSSSLFNTDTYYTQHQSESNRRKSSAISRWSLANKHGERERVCLIYLLFFCSLFNTDTYYTQPERKSNRRERGAISGWSLANKHGERERVCLMYLYFLFLI
jgi:hypothetical protein